jgi:hypothetical protein
MKYLAIIALALASLTAAHAGDDYYLERVRQQLQLDEIQRQTRESAISLEPPRKMRKLRIIRTRIFRSNAAQQTDVLDVPLMRYDTILVYYGLCLGSLV